LSWCFPAGEPVLSPYQTPGFLFPPRSRNVLLFRATCLFHPLLPLLFFPLCRVEEVGEYFLFVTARYPLDERLDFLMPISPSRIFFLVLLGELFFLFCCLVLFPFLTILCRLLIFFSSIPGFPLRGSRFSRRKLPCPLGRSLPFLAVFPSPLSWFFNKNSLTNSLSFLFSDLLYLSFIFFFHEERPVLFLFPFFYSSHKDLVVSAARPVRTA